MPHPSDLTKQAIDRLMNLKEFTVSVPVEENWLPNGVVPFDINIKDDEIEAKVWAVDFEEAVNRLDEWIETCK